MQNPARQKGIGGEARVPASKAEQLTRRFLPYFPNKSIIIKMEKARRLDHTGEHSLDRLDFQTRIEIGKRSIGEDETDVEPDQRTASSEDKAHKPTDITVFFDAVTIVNPDER